MLPLLLKQNELDSIHILASTIYQLNCSVPHINKYILNGKTTIKQNIAILNDTFDYLGYDDLKLSISSGKVILTNFDYSVHDNILLHVAEYFILDSPTYKTILVLQNEQHSHKDALLNQVHISESYLSKIMKEINDFLDPVNVAIISRKKEYIFDGPVANWIYIDFFARLFFSLLSSPFNLPLETDPFEYLANDVSEQKHQLLVQALNSFPIPEEGYIGDPEALEVIQHILTINPSHLKWESTNALSEEQIVLYGLYIRLASSYIDNTAQRQAIGQSLIMMFNTGTNNSIINDTIKLVDHFYLQVYQTDQRFSDAYFETLYLVLLKQLKYRVTKTNIKTLFYLTPYFLPNFQPNYDEIGNRINHFYTNEINHLPLTHHTYKMINCFKHQLFHELYSIVNSEKSGTILIYVKMNYKLSQTFFIKKMLSQTFAADCLSFTKDITKADLIISDHHLINNHKAPLFYLVDSNSKEALNSLLTIIFKIITEKRYDSVLKMIEI